MRVVHLQHPPLPLILFFLCFWLLHAGFGLCSDQTTSSFQVVGFGECADCKQNHFQTTQAFSGLHVTIDCKLKTGEMKRVGESNLDDQGKFNISLPENIVQDGKKLKHECYAQLHNAAAMPCPAHNGLSKIAFVSQANNKHTFSPSKPLEFSTALCTSKFLWPHYKYPPHPWKKFKNIPKIPYSPHPWKKNIPKIPFPPLHKHIPVIQSPVPYVKPVLPPHLPLYKKPYPPLVHKLPHLPKIHPKYYFKHPKYGFVPPKPQP